MPKLFVIIFMFFYCTGTLLLPMGDFSCAKDITGAYDQCRDEDPDLNPADFVFEHLLNLGSVLAHFEHETNEEENEKPHAPFQQLQSVSQTFVIVSKPLQLEAMQASFSFIEERTYPTCPEDFLTSDFLTKVFHPPSVC